MQDELEQPVAGTMRLDVKRVPRHWHRKDGKNDLGARCLWCCCAKRIGYRCFACKQFKRSPRDTLDPLWGAWCISSRSRVRGVHVFWAVFLESLRATDLDPAWAQEVCEPAMPGVPLEHSLSHSSSTVTVRQGVFLRGCENSYHKW